MDLIQSFSWLWSAVFTLLVTIIAFYFKNSVAKIRYKITINTLAKGLHHDFWGKIDIHHNDFKINHLHHINVQFKNLSWRNFGELPIRVSCPGSMIRSDYAYNVPNRVQLEYSSNFLSAVESENSWINENREFHAKCLNRKDVISIDLLIDSEKEDIEIKDIIPIVDVPNIRAVLYEPYSDSHTNWGFFVLTTILNMVVGSVVYYFYPDSLIPILIMTIVGGFGFYLAVLFYYLIFGWEHIDDDD